MIDCRKGNQGKTAHPEVEATIIHHFNTYTHITATKPFPNGKQGDIPLGHHHLDNLATTTSKNPLGVTNQHVINRASLGHQRP